MTTANDVTNRAKHYLGTREHPANSNHVPGITDHFGNGSWCFMYVSTVFNDLGAIDLIHGWHAYVPDFYSIFHPHGEYHTSDPKPGDLVAFDFNRTNSPEHIGIVLRVISSSLIQTIEGNTGGSGGDGVYIKTRSRSDVYAYATPKYGTNTIAGVEDMPTYVSIDKTDHSRKEKLAKGVWQQVYFDKNNSKGSAKHHSKGDYPSFVTGGAYYQGEVYLTIKDFAPGANGQVRAYYVDENNTTMASCAISEFKGTEANTYVEKSLTGFVPKGQKLRIEVVNLDSTTEPTVIAGQVRVMVWET